MIRPHHSTKPDRPFLYKIRMYLFGQKFTKKERFIHSMNCIFVCGAHGIGLPVILDFMGGADQDATLDTFLLLMLYLSFFTCLAFSIGYYSIKIVTDVTIGIYSFIKFKLTGKPHIPDNRKY